MTWSTATAAGHLGLDVLRLPASLQEAVRAEDGAPNECRMRRL